MDVMRRQNGLSRISGTEHDCTLPIVAMQSIVSVPRLFEYPGAIRFLQIFRSMASEINHRCPTSASTTTGFQGEAR
jgi:hypothetical protein